MMQGQPPARQNPPATSPVAAQEVRPKFRAQRHLVKVREVRWVTPSTYLIYFTMADNGGSQPVFGFQAGQFLSIFVEKEGRTINRSYSIASSPDEKDAVELCIKVVEGGFMSNYLKDRQPGDRYRIIAPLGGFILQEPITTDVAFISTGTGIAPFVGMAKHIFEHGNVDHELYMITGTRHVKELLYHDLFLAWERKYPNFHYLPTISRPETPDWKGRVGYVEKVVQETIAKPGQATAYICGLHQMVEQTRELCTMMGFASVRVEKWD